MNLAPCAAVLWTVLLAFAFAFTQELDARAVHQQMQRLSAGTVAQLHLQALLAATDGAEIWHRSVQLGQLQQTLHHAKRLAQRLIKKAFDTQAKLDRCIREQPASSTLAAGLSPFRYTQLPAKFLPRKVEGNRWAGQALNLRR